MVCIKSKKLIIFGILVAFLLSITPVSADLQFINPVTLNKTCDDWGIFGEFCYGYQINIQFLDMPNYISHYRTTNESTSDITVYGNYDRDGDTYILFNTLDGNGSSTAKVVWECTDNADGEYELGPSWEVTGTAMAILFDNYDDTTSLYINSIQGERSTIDWHSDCHFIFSDIDEPITITVANQPKYSKNIEVVFSLTNNAMSELASKIQIILVSVYDTIEIGIMVLTAMLFFFIIVFMWKVFEFFVNRVRYGGGRR